MVYVKKQNILTGNKSQLYRLNQTIIVFAKLSLTNIVHLVQEFNINKLKTSCHLPPQSVPFPSYPGLQVHVYEPSVFSQLAFSSQSLSVASAHSSISVCKNGVSNYFQN